jgi:AAA15 family ATPase/GTPase
MRSVTIRGFKSFKNFNLSGLQRVNLIGGKNNIGKTAFLEALQLHCGGTPHGVVRMLREIVFRRQSKIYDREKRDFELDVFYQDLMGFSVEVDGIILNVDTVDDLVRVRDDKRFSVRLLSKEAFLDVSANNDGLDISSEPAIKISIENESRVFPRGGISRDSFIRRKEADIKDKVNYVGSCRMDEKQIAILYGHLVDIDKEIFLDHSLYLFDESLRSLKQVYTESGMSLKLLAHDQNKPMPLSSFGEGVNRYIAILCAIWASQDGYLFIDEIENGIHYTNYPKLWGLIFEAAHLANCQVFITTHSKECIEAFNTENKENDGAYFEFYRHAKTRDIAVKNRDHEQLDYALTHAGRIRGE